MAHPLTFSWQDTWKGFFKQMLATCLLPTTYETYKDTGLESGKADLVMASLLFHELPQTIARTVLHEMMRLLRPGCRLIIFDPIQCAFPWKCMNNAVNVLLMKIMHEIYWMDYMKEPLWVVCQQAGLQEVERKLFPALPWIYQVVTARK